MKTEWWVSRGAGILLAACLAVGRPAAQDAEAPPTLGFEELRNGLQVRFVPVAGSGAVCLALALRVGAEHDPAGRTGLAQVLAEALRLREEGVPEPQRVRVVVRDAATMAGLIVPSADLEAGLARLRPWLAGDPGFDADLVARAVARAKLRADDATRIFPGPMLYSMARRALLRGTPQGRQSVGIPGEMDRIDAAFLRDWADRCLRPRHAVLVVLGDVSEKAMRAAVDGALASLPRGDREAPPPTVYDPLGEVPASLVHDRLEAPYVAAAWRAPAAGDPHWAAFVVAMTVLGGRAALAFHQPRGREAAARARPFFFPWLEGGRVVMMIRRARDGEGPERARAELEDFLDAARRFGPDPAEVARAAAAVALEVTPPPYPEALVRPMRRHPQALYGPALTLAMGQVLGRPGDLPDRIGSLPAVAVRRALVEAVRSPLWLVLVPE